MVLTPRRSHSGDFRSPLAGLVIFAFILSCSVTFAEAFRPPDQRPRHDLDLAKQHQIARYESKHLVLFTDIDPEQAKGLPAFFDQAYDALVEYFGPPPPAKDGSEYQLTGYLMQVRERFRQAGMLPKEAEFQHGKNAGYEFWMDDQEFDYYRRHLLVHEGTHCFMMAREEKSGQSLPLWYLEGTAELFGTHSIDEKGKATFRAMPDKLERFLGFERIEMVRKAIDTGRFRSVRGVIELTNDEFTRDRAGPYAWSWAFCKFLDTHPRYQKRFRELGQHLVGDEFGELMQESFAPDKDVLWAEWEQFARTLEYRYDIPRSAIAFEKGTPLIVGETRELPIRADIGWQSSKIWLEADTDYEISATGKVVLQKALKQSDSEAEGISIYYASGRPIGRLLGAIQATEPPDEQGRGSLRDVLDLGKSRTIRPTIAGTLYLRVNESWGDLADNTGSFQVRVKAAK